MRKQILLRLVAVLALVFVVAGCVQSIPVTVEQVDVTIPLGELGVKPAPDDWATEPLSSYPAGIYRTEGGLKLVAPTGTEIEMHSGSVLDIQSGTTSTFGGDLDIEGTLTVDTINETTASNGVVIESVTVLDGGVSATAPITTSSTISATGNIRTPAALVADTVSEFTSGSGVTADGVLLKDFGATMSGSLVVDTISEYTANNGVVIESVTFKDGGGDFGANITTTGAISVQAAISLGSGVATDTIDELRPGSGVDIDDVLVKDGGIDLTGGALVFQNDDTMDNPSSGLLVIAATALRVDGNMSAIGTLGATGAITSGGSIDAQGGDYIMENDDTLSNPSSGLILLEATEVKADGNFAALGTLGATGNITTAGNIELNGAISDTSATVLISDGVHIDGNEDVVQLRVQALAGQAAQVFVVENADGTDGFKVDEEGNTVVSGTLTLENANLILENGEEIDNAANGVIGMTARDVSISNFMRYVPQTPIEIADGGWLTPTGTFQGIYAAGSIGFSRIYTTGYLDGDLLILYNIVAETVVITSEHDTHLSTTRTLEIGDILTMVFTNTAWWETGYSDN